MRLLVFGYSHTWALRAANGTPWKRIGDHENHDVVIALCGTGEFPGSLVYKDNRGRNHVNAAFLSALYRSKGDPKSDIIVSCIQGNQYNTAGLLIEDKPIDVVLPEKQQCEIDGANIIPYNAIYDHLAEQWSEYRHFVNIVRNFNYKSFFHVCPPPPIFDNDYIKSELEKLQNSGKIEVSHPSIRLKLWMIQKKILEEIITDAGGVLINPPTEAVDERGFLKQTYWKDSVHANTAYGQLVLNDLSVAARAIASRKEV